MSYFNACVLIARNGSSLEQMAEKASIMLSRFDINKETQPYKRHIEAEELQRIASHYGIDSSDHQAIAAKLEDWNGDKGGVDDCGVYELSTKNPDGHIDGWSIESEVKPKDRGRLLFGQSGEEKAVKVIVMPDGKWLDGPWVYGSPNAERQKELDEWDKKITSALQEHPDSVVFLASCHI